MDERQIERWEAQREIKNLMGRYVRALLHKEEGEILNRFWSSREDISLGLNEGWYLGRASVGAYYDHRVRQMELSDRLVKNRFPGVPQVQEGRGLGYLEMKALSSDLVEIGEQGDSAKGMWACSGQVPHFTERGPVTHLTFGVYGVDFVREGEEFRILHMQYLEEIHHPQGEKWWEPEKSRPVLPEFAEMKHLPPVEPDVRVTLYEKWAPRRGLRELLPLPEPYDTLENTFSYGWREAEK